MYACIVGVFYTLCSWEKDAHIVNRSTDCYFSYNYWHSCHKTISIAVTSREPLSLVTSMVIGYIKFTTVSNTLEVLEQSLAYTGRQAEYESKVDYKNEHPHRATLLN